MPASSGSYRSLGHDNRPRGRARAAFPGKPYVNLEAADERAFAQSDPRAFLARFPDGAILDEAQHAPELFSYIQVRVDDDQRPGRFVLTGSHNFLVLEKITQSLAGRTGIVRLLPLSLRERTAFGITTGSVDEFLYRGFYPHLYATAGDLSDWYRTYVTIYGLVYGGDDSYVRSGVTVRSWRDL